MRANKWKARRPIAARMPPKMIRTARKRRASWPASRQSIWARCSCSSRAPNVRARTAADTISAALFRGRRLRRSRSWPKCFRKIFGAALEFAAARQFSEEPFQGAGVAFGDEMIRPAIRDQFALVNNDHAIAHAFDDIQNM